MEDIKAKQDLDNCPKKHTDLHTDIANMRPTGFLDLPVELRQQIYRECMVWRGDHGVLTHVTLPDNEAQDLRLYNLRLACPRLAGEMRDIWSNKCKTLNFVVSPHRLWHPPPLMGLPRLQCLRIEFDHLSPNLFKRDMDQAACEQRRACLTMMHRNLTVFSDWIKKSLNNQSLECLMFDWRHADQRHPTWWRPRVNSEGNLVKSRLRTIPGAGGRPISMLEVTLLMVKPLPPTASATLALVDETFPDDAMPVAWGYEEQGDTDSEAEQERCRSWQAGERSTYHYKTKYNKYGAPESCRFSDAYAHDLTSAYDDWLCGKRKRPRRGEIDKTQIWNDVIERPIRRGSFDSDISDFSI